MPVLREARMDDLEAIGQVAHATGFFGASAERFFPDPTLFTDLWVRPYLAGAGCGNWVAEDAGAILGYIIGTCDLQAYGRWMLGYGPRVLKDALFGRYPNVLGALPYLLRMARYPSRLAPFGLYPAQLHVNLLPGSRGMGLGGQLLEHFLHDLRRRKVRGVQLSTTRDNSAALGLYQRFGFETFREYPSPLWRPWLGRDAIHLTMTLALT
ncbi:MAG: GNAT family N-acetyltransferase [Meiothermus sp.]|nr:GNAT family N-acetyltransferase [Meiothermus sp.]